jgi:hypothetical protein
MSDKYTPTTEDVFDAYDRSYDQVEFPSDKEYQEHLAGGGARGEFYRWLAEHDRQVAHDAVDDFAHHLGL